MDHKEKEQENKILDESKPFRLDKPRISPLTEIQFINELYQLHEATKSIEYTKEDNFNSEWERELSALVKWLKDYNNNMLNGLSSFLKLEENGLNIDSINFEDYTDSIKSFIEQEGNIYHIRGTMSKNRKLRLKWIMLASHVTFNSSLPLRDKEILILRNAWLCQSEYEWDHHYLVGKRAGLSKEEIEQIKIGSEGKGWSNFDKSLLHAVDELHADKIISENTWKELSDKYDTNQLMDLIFVVGSYNMLAMFMNSIGLQTEDCVKKQLD
ncbi:MAG: carboxymuconolactone decarboxylase family protein [Promethearchaeota archaeon]|jgi:alkylhydroperoxidase family enzyme